MTITHRRFARSALVALVALSAFGSAASAAQFKARTSTPPPRALGFKAAPGGGQSKGHVETCNNAASCNLMIAYCIGHGGDWQETPGTAGPQGEPTKGKCTYP